MIPSKIPLTVALVFLTVPHAVSIGNEEFGTPNEQMLLRHLNDNARLMQGVRCEVVLDLKTEQERIGLSGKLICQRPRNLHLNGSCLCTTVFDLGCNKDQSWFWNRPMFGKHPREKAGDVRSLPLRPEWLLDVLGIAEYDTKKKYTLKCDNSYLYLSEEVLSPQGIPFRKVIVFHRSKNAVGQVATVVLKDTEDQILCRADIQRTYTDEKTKARLAQDIVFQYPSQKLEVHMQLLNVKLVRLTPKQAAAAFSPKKSSETVNVKQPASAITVHLTKEAMTARYGDEMLTLSGQCGSPLALRLLEGQFQAWKDQKTALDLQIICSPSVEYASAHAVLEAGRRAGLRKIAVRIGDKNDQ